MGLVEGQAAPERGRARDQRRAALEAPHHDAEEAARQLALLEH
jgi:hypothetical protein